MNMETKNERELSECNSWQLNVGFRAKNVLLHDLLCCFSIILVLKTWVIANIIRVAYKTTDAVSKTSCIWISFCVDIEKLLDVLSPINIFPKTQSRPIHKH